MLMNLSQLTQDLVVILRLASLEGCLRFFEFRPQREHIRMVTLELGLLECRFEVGNGGIVFLEVEIDARPCT